MLASTLNEIKIASQTLGEEVLAGLWLSRIRPRWWHGASSGTELDLILVILLLPFIAWHWLWRSSRQPKIEQGPVFCAVTKNQLVMFDATEGIFRRGLKDIFDRRDLGEIASCTFHAEIGRQLRLEFSDSTQLLLYYSGPSQELETFISKTT